METNIMTEWHPGKGDYVKQNAMEDSKRRKKSELRTGIIVSVLVIAIVVLLLIVLNLFVL